MLKFSPKRLRGLVYKPFAVPRRVQDVLGMWPLIENLPSVGQVVQSDAFCFGRPSTIGSADNDDEVSVILVCSRHADYSAKRASMKYVITDRVTQYSADSLPEFRYLALPLDQNGRFLVGEKPIMFILCGLPDPCRRDHVNLDAHKMLVLGEMV